MPQNPEYAYQALGGGMGERLATAHLDPMVPCESFIYPESAVDIDRDTQNRVLEAEFWRFWGFLRSPTCAW